MCCLHRKNLIPEESLLFLGRLLEFKVSITQVPGGLNGGRVPGLALSANNWLRLNVEKIPSPTSVVPLTGKSKRTPWVR